MSLTQGFKKISFWGAKKTWRRLPNGVRPYPEVALLDSTPELLQRGVVQLKYGDKTPLTVEITDLSIGVVWDAYQITQKYLMVDKGERDMTGVTHG
jgi:hypothetical protein